MRLQGDDKIKNITKDLEFHNSYFKGSFFKSLKILLRFK